MSETSVILDEAEVYRLHAERASLQVQLDAVAARIAEIDSAIVASGEAKLRANRAAHPVRMYPPTHPFPGSSSERQGVGDPGHCEDCAEFGHVAAHPRLGCGDVGCSADHGPEEDADIEGVLALTAKRRRG